MFQVRERKVRRGNTVYEMNVSPKKVVDTKAFSKNYLVHDWDQAVTCVCKTRKRNAIHFRVSGPVISLKAPNSFSDLAAGKQGGMPLAPLREKSGTPVALATQVITG
jgi:hypothetical protein